MSQFFPLSQAECQTIAMEFRLRTGWVQGLTYVPYVIILAFSILDIIPATRPFAIMLTWETRPIELLTFVGFLVASIFGGRLAWRLHQGRQSKWHWGFYLANATAMFVIAMEEIAWGQVFLRFQTPDYWRAINAQQELTLHNVHVFQAHLEVFPMSSGLLGLIGVGLYVRRRFLLLMPPPFLVPWFLPIFVISAFDLMHEFFIFHAGFDALVNDLDEVIEMLIAFVSVLFMILKSQQLTGVLQPKKR